MEKEPTLNALCEKVTALEEKTKHLEEEITNLKKENEKLKSQQNSNTNIVPVTQGDKILFEVMSDIFYVSKYKLSKDFLRHIEQFGLSEDYQKELFNKFNSKIRKIYDVKTDGDTLIGFMTKVFGKKNIVTFHSLSVDNEIINVQIAFLYGKFEFVNNYFNFNNTELYTYGDYQNVDGDIFYEQGSINFIVKIRDNFVNNPVLFIDEDKTKLEEFFENNSEDKVAELFNEYQPRELNVTDLMIYEIPEE